MSKLNPSQLPGTHRTRVFVGGSYARQSRQLLDALCLSVARSGFEPIVADQFELLIPDHDIHDLTLFLMHSCRLALFEVSLASGALMEVERSIDYGTRCLLLRRRESLPVSRMLSSFAKEHADRMRIVDYIRPSDAVRQAEQWLRSMKRMTYDRDAL